MAKKVAKKKSVSEDRSPPRRAPKKRTPATSAGAALGKTSAAPAVKTPVKSPAKPVTKVAKTAKVSKSAKAAKAAKTVKVAKTATKTPEAGKATRSAKTNSNPPVKTKAAAPRSLKDIPGDPRGKTSSGTNPNPEVARKQPAVTSIGQKASAPRATSPVGRVGTGAGKNPILIVAGEHSGDLLGGDLARALKQSGENHFFGTGGPTMQAAGVELIKDVDSMAVVGFVEAFKAYRRLKKLARRLAEMAFERETKLAILIDYPGFNLRLAEMLQAKGVKVVFLVSPQIWAWNFRRIKTIKKNVDLMLTLFPFERDIYEERGVNVRWIGHPMVERLPRELKKQKAISRGRRKTVIGLLPGSRRSEVTALLPGMLQAAVLLKEKFPGAFFLLPGINPRVEQFIRAELEKYPDLPLEFTPGRSLRVMEASDVVVVASGTATLETAMMDRPMVLVYRVGLLNYLLGSLVTRTRFIGIINILASRQVAVELLQSEANPENIARETARILEDEEYRAGIMNELSVVRSQLGQGNPAEKAARYIREFMREFVG